MHDINADRVWETITGGIPLDGQGLVIGDIDSGIDFYHPAFFRADGPLVEWIDVNHNGRLDPGVDAIDLDHNGVAGANETAGFIDSTISNGFDATPILGTPNNIY